MYVLRESRPPAPGQQHGYSVDPPLGSGCEIVWYINGQPVGLGSSVGGLEVKGFGASGSITVEVVGDASTTRVHARVDCPNAPAEQVGPMRVGTGAWDPCAMEPCRSRRLDYVAAVRAAFGASALLKRWCATVQQWRAFLFLILLSMALVVIGVILCHVLRWPAPVCAGLYVVLAGLSALVAAVQLWLARVTSHMFHAKIDCYRASAAMHEARSYMIHDCPNECWLPREDTDCECR